MLGLNFIPNQFNLPTNDWYFCVCLDFFLAYCLSKGMLLLIFK